MQTIKHEGSSTQEHVPSSESLSLPQSQEPKPLSPIDHLWLLTDGSPQIRQHFAHHLLALDEEILIFHAQKIATEINTALLMEPISVRNEWPITDDASLARQRTLLSILQKLPAEKRVPCRNGLLRVMFSTDLGIQEEALNLLQDDTELPPSYIYPLILAEKQVMHRAFRYSASPQDNKRLETHLTRLRMFYLKHSRMPEFSGPLPTVSALLVDSWRDVDRGEPGRLLTVKRVQAELKEREGLVPMYISLLAASEQGPIECLHHSLRLLGAAFPGPLSEDLQTYGEVFAENARSLKDYETEHLTTSHLTQGDPRWIPSYMSSAFCLIDHALQTNPPLGKFAEGCQSLGELLRDLETRTDLPEDEAVRYQQSILRKLKVRFRDCHSIFERRTFLSTMAQSQRNIHDCLAFTGELLMGDLHPRDKGSLLPVIQKLYDQQRVASFPQEHPIYQATIGALVYLSSDMEQAKDVEELNLCSKALRVYEDLVELALAQRSMR